MKANQNSRSRYRCSDHPDTWMQLDVHAGPFGDVVYWRCPVPDCYRMKPAKWATGSRRARSAQAQAARQARDLPLWSGNIMHIDTRITTC